MTPPATAAWRPGDPPGRRRFVEAFGDGALALEAGGKLGDVTIAYETWGDPDPARAVLVCHALTADSHVAGDAEPGHPSPGWWDALVGPGRALDPERHWIVCANVLGGCQGTTGPASPADDGAAWGSRFPRTTIRDQVAVEVALADHLGVDVWAGVVGGSMGGMRVLEWAIGQPERVAHAVVLASTAVASAEQIATQSTQIAAITADPRWRGGDYHDAPAGEGPHVGLGIARRIGHLTYRTEAELAGRFANAAQAEEVPLSGGRYAVQSYLDHQADKLARRFDAGTYVALSEAMNHHDVGRDRGGVEAALARIRADITVIGIDSDRLYPLDQQRRIAEPTGAELHVVASAVGHDGFLLEADALNPLIRAALT